MSEKTLSKKAQELHELQQAQLSDSAPKIKANKSDKHDIAEAAKDYVHVELTTRINNPATQSYDDSKTVRAFRPADFEAMEAAGAFKSYYGAEIVHDPRSKADKKATEKKADK